MPPTITMIAPVVSFCIPTFNRGRYLDSLLGSLTQLLADFPHSYEVFISDNGSPDETPEVVARYAEQLPLRYVRHESNQGGGPNWQYLMKHAQGRYVVYVADDDCILGPEVARIITLLEANPEVGVAYAPWKLFDLVTDKDMGQFYRQDEDVVVPQGRYLQLLDAVLRFKAFPEIYIGRRDLILKIMPRVQEQSFYAFVHAAEFAEHAAVLFLKDPYYVSVTNYFADHQREQAGSQEAEVAWDRYRSGLEYILGRAAGQITEEQRLEFMRRIEVMIAERVAVAVRLRVAHQRDPVETYYLAYRLKAMGAERLLSVPLPTLAAYAAMEFLLCDGELNRGVSELVCLGAFPADVRTYIDRHAKVPVRHVDTLEQWAGGEESTLVFTRAGIQPEQLPAHCRARQISEENLLCKFVS